MGLHFINQEIAIPVMFGKYDKAEIVTGIFFYRFLFKRNLVCKIGHLHFAYERIVAAAACKERKRERGSNLE